MSSTSRHHKLTRLTRHTHEWVMAWLSKHGWKLHSVDVQSRQSLYAGHRGAGTTYMENLETGDRPRCVGIPGARCPKEPLSKAEWAQFMRDLSSIYNEWGVPPPRAHHRMWKAK